MNVFVHIQHAAEDCPRILVKTVDSDVVVIALSAYNCLDSLRVEQDPVNWGWMKEDNKCIPVWSSLPELSNVTKVLIRCGHTDCELGSCKCRKNGLRCTELCGCQGKCQTGPITLNEVSLLLICYVNIKHRDFVLDVNNDNYNVMFIC